LALLVVGAALLGTAGYVVSRPSVESLDLDPTPTAGGDRLRPGLPCRQIPRLAKYALKNQSMVLFCSRIQSLAPLNSAAHPCAAGKP